jgi:hypothetical protein
MKKNIGYILVILGILHYLLFFFNGRTFGWLEFVFGVNIISQYGAGFMIAFGVELIRRGRGQEKSEIDLVLDLNDGEEIIYKNTGSVSIIILTTKKIIYRAFAVTDTTIEMNNNVFPYEKGTFQYSDINNVSPIKVKDIAKSKLGKLSGLKFGISLNMKDGNIINLPAAKSELICAHLSKFIR